MPGALREPVAKSATPVTYLPYSYVTEQKLGRSHFKSECGVGGRGELGWVGILCNGGGTPKVWQRSEEADILIGAFCVICGVRRTLKNRCGVA